MQRKGNWQNAPLCNVVFDNHHNSIQHILLINASNRMGPNSRWLISTKLYHQVALLSQILPPQRHLSIVNGTNFMTSGSWYMEAWDRHTEDRESALAVKKSEIFQSSYRFKCDFITVLASYFHLFFPSFFPDGALRSLRYRMNYTNTKPSSEILNLSRKTIKSV